MELSLLSVLRSLYLDCHVLEMLLGIVWGTKWLEGSTRHSLSTFKYDHGKAAHTRVGVKHLLDTQQRSRHGGIV